MRSCDVSSSPNIFSSVDIKKNEMGGTCSMYAGEERFIQSFGGETQRKETTWKAQA